MGGIGLARTDLADRPEFDWMDLTDLADLSVWADWIGSDRMDLADRVRLHSIRSKWIDWIALGWFESDRVDRVGADGSDWTYGT